MDTNDRMNEWGCRWVVVDIETTGLDAAKQGIVEIAAKTDEGEVFELQCRPEGAAMDVEPEALQVNGYLINLEEFEKPDCAAVDALALEDDLLPQRWAVAKLLGWLMKKNPAGRWTLVGRSPKFDLGFLQKASGLAYRVFDREPIDLHDLVRFELVARGIRPARFTTNERYALLGWPPEPLPHRALNGVESEWVVYQQFLKWHARDYGYYGGGCGAKATPLRDGLGGLQA